MLKGKKILILGGASQHIKFVEAAKKLGIYSVVTDYLQESICKRMCDEALFLNITDIDGIVGYCRENHIDGVVSAFLDPCQIPYGQICEKLDLPCYATLEQFERFTNKRLFKELCRKSGINVIHDYTQRDIDNNNIQYPVFVKPVDSRGSRGQSVCYSKEELTTALVNAKKESSNGDYLIEQYWGDCDEIQITCFVIDGKIYIERTTDCYRGSSELNLQKVVNCSVSPSKYTDLYIEKAHPAICRMIKELGITNGPVFFQGFVKNEEIYFFDPGLRFPGVEFERIYEKVWGVDFAELLIYFSLNGKFPELTELPIDGAKLKGNYAAVFFPVLRAGTISKIEGDKNWKKGSNIISYFTRYVVGDSIDWTFNVNQRYAEIDIYGSNMDEIASAIDSFYREVSILDNNGISMLFDRFNTGLLNKSDATIRGKKYNIPIHVICEEDLIKSGCFNVPEAIKITKDAFLKRSKNAFLFSKKVSVVFDEKSQSRINCLLAGNLEDNVYGIKWISVYPDNPSKFGLQNVSAVLLLSELRTGFPKALMEGTLCSNLRTASTSAVAAKYLAKKKPQSIGFIGAGDQAKTHLMTFLHVFPSIKECRVSSRTIESEMKFINQMSRLYPELNFIPCYSDYEAAVRGSDIIITAISGQEKILQADWLSKGTLYCHVAGLEDDFSVPKTCDKIVCDDWEATKHRTQTISQMYHLGLLNDDDIYGNLADLVSGKIMGRVSDDEIIYFNTVGMSFVDIMLANHMYNKVISHGYGKPILLQEHSMFDLSEEYIIR